jgi:hypothetical protein
VRAVSDPVFLPPPTRPPRTRILMILAAAAITAALLVTALYFGDRVRRMQIAVTHEARLERLLAHKPTPHRDQVVQALRDEGMTVQGSARTPEERTRLAERGGGGRRDEILAQASRFALAEAYASKDAVYVLYYDAEGWLRAFTYVSP